jgi:hypothetical protein
MDTPSSVPQFSLEAWFRSWVDALDAPAEIPEAAWPPSTLRMVLEALSDAAPEQFLNPLVAQHLRRYGTQIAQKAKSDRIFWVRSEWEKVDLSYGFAIPFALGARAWDAAWRRGHTGDCGQIEVKAIYSHRYEGTMGILAAQLEQRFQRDKRRNAPDLARQRYHGLVWLFDHGLGHEAELEGWVRDEALRLGLRMAVQPKTMATHDLGSLWPSTGGKPYRCAMSLALLELASARS